MRVHDVTVLDADEVQTVLPDAVIVGTTKEVRPGDILISEAGAGLLRRVESVEDRGALRYVQTAPAHLGDVIRDGDFHLDLNLQDGETLTGWQQSNGATLDGVSWSIPETKLVDIPGLDVRIKKGSFSFDPQLFVDFSVHNLNFTDFVFGAYGDIAADLEIDVVGDGTVTVPLTTWPIAESPTYKFATAIGPVPVIVTTRIELNVGVSASCKGSFRSTQSIGVDGWVDLAAQYNGDQWSTYGGHEFSVVHSGQKVLATSEFAGRFFVEGRVVFAFYDIVGPTVALRPFAEMAVQPGKPPTWSSSLGLQGRAGGEIKFNDVYKIGLDAPLFDWKHPIASGKLGLTCQSQVGSAPWLGSQKCNRAGALENLLGLESCIKGGGGKTCLTDPKRYPSVLCGPGSGGGYTCKLDDLFSCLCSGGGQACFSDAKALCKLG